MVRQVALGAVVAFGVSVLALSVWEPKPLIAPAPAPAPAAPAPPPGPGPAIAPAPRFEKPFKPASLRPESLSHFVRQPAILVQIADAGPPTP